MYQIISLEVHNITSNQTSINADELIVKSTAQKQ